ncbi:suppressor of lurcher protein 1 [Folsomia candida]|uniref:suppressor of lurcher protein 1 n=1 Tax=Folsomia candida TaxID=158441 RepID=UPI000B8F5F03|nr:suppressor of lurcher protein 1 [Folsomia candida]
MHTAKKLQLCISFYILVRYSVQSAYLDNVPRCMPLVQSNEHEKNGTFSSNDYPSHYPAKTHCRFDFIGNPKERVKIVFTDFNLYHPDGAYSQGDRLSNKGGGHSVSQNQRERDEERRKEREKDCSGEDVDVLSAFVYDADDNLDRIDDYCGSAPPLSIMSSSNKLTLEFRSSTSSQYVRGFSALYSFVEDFGIMTGQQASGYPCRFIFNSTETSNGTIASPNYPGLYPRNTECHYFFNGKDNEHVELHFTYFHIDGVQPCDDDTYSDYVELSNYIPIDRKYDRKCGTMESGFKVKSDRKFFRVNFKSNDRYDATGFEATYQFTDKANHLTIRNIRNHGQIPTFWMTPHVSILILYANMLVLM